MEENLVHAHGEVFESFNTTRTHLLVGLFTFITTLQIASMSVIGLTQYVTNWNLPLLWYFNSSGISVLVNSLTEFGVSTFADSYQSPYGRRKPFVLVGMIITTIAATAICLPPSHTASFSIVWYILGIIVYNFGVGVLNNPFASWIIESCADNAEYRSIRSTTINIFAFCGGLTGALLCTFLPIGCAIIGLLGSLVATPLLLKYVPNKVIRKANKQLPLVPSFRIAARSNEFRTIFINRCLILSVQNIFGTATAFIVLIAFNQDNLKLYYMAVLILAIIGGIGSVLLVTAFNWVLRKVEKLKAYLVLSLGIAGIATVCFFVSFVPNITGFYILLFFFLMSLFIYGPLTLIEQLMIRDLIVFDTFITGLRRENMYYTAITLPPGVITTVAGAIPLVVLSFTGFHQDENADDDDSVRGQYNWTPGSIWVLRIFGYVLCGALALYSFYLVKNFTITQKISDQLNAVVVAKEENDAAASSEKTNVFPDQNGIAAEEDRLQLLHLSVEENRLISLKATEAVEADGVNRMLLTIARYNFVSLTLVCTVAVFTLVLFFVDGTISTGSFSTLLLALLMLQIGFLIYELLRYTALRVILTWPPHRVSTGSTAVYNEFASFHESLRDMIDRGGIDVKDDSAAAPAAGGPDESYTASLFMKDKTSSLLSPVIDENETANDIAAAKSNKIVGYKRIYTALLVCLAIDILILLLDCYHDAA